MRNILLTLMTVFLLFGCGAKESKPSKRGVYVNSYNRTPVQLYKEYPVCAESDSYDRSPYFELSQFLGGFAYSRNVNVEHSLSGDRLEGRQIENTFYAADLMIARRYKGTRPAGATFEKTNTPKVMRICPGVKKYERYTYENASLSATYSIGKAAAKLKEIGYEAREKVDVYVSPKLVERYIFEGSDEVRTEDYIATDNAFYFPHIRSVVFLPQSEESREGAGFGNIPLWEVPMVGAHEYAHHVFHDIMSSAQGSLNAFNHSCFSAMTPEEALIKKDGLRDVGTSDVLNSLNEGFADLIAFYSLDKEERGLENVICMEASREVGSSRFANGDMKEFDRKFMRTFLSRERIETVGCYSPDFQAIHHVGAVFANVSDRLMNRMGLSKSEKLAAIIGWLKEMNRNYSTLSNYTAEKFLIKTYFMMAESAMRRSNSLASLKCYHTEELMPDSRFSMDELEALGCR